MYRYTETGSILRDDGATIPADERNRDYRAAMAWVAAGNVIAPYAPPPPTVSQIVQERTRRLALGFDYDFGGARGVHRIGTTADDMTGWREVTDYANALIDLGDVTTEIAIVTDTGPVSVTAPEWQAVMLTAARTRQVIWEKSFALQAMQPIPADYADDRHWS